MVQSGSLKVQKHTPNLCLCLLAKAVRQKGPVELHEEGDGLVC